YTVFAASADRQLATVVVDDLCFDRRRHFAAAACFCSAWTVRQKIVGGFRRADHIQKLQARVLLPLVENRRGQRLAGRQTDAQGTEIVFLLDAQQAGGQPGGRKKKNRDCLCG